MLAKIGRDRTSTFTSVTMRESHMSNKRLGCAAYSKEGSTVHACGRASRVETDKDCAGCVLTRKSMTCAHLFHGVNLLKARSWMQGTRRS